MSNEPLRADLRPATYSPWRWLTGAVLLLGMFGDYLLFSAPSPILSVIVDALGVNLTAGGLLISVVSLVVAGVGLVFDRLKEYAQPRTICLIGLILMAVGQMLLLVAHSFGWALFFRLVSGVGIGLLTPVYAVLVMDIFPERERPVVNTIYAALPYVSSAILLWTTVPLLYACGGSWQLTMFAIGAFMAVVALLWWLLRKQVANHNKQSDRGPGMKGLLGKVIRNREVRLLTIADICDIWGFTFFSSFLPTYFSLEQGLSLEAAARLVAIFPVAGIAAALICGFWMNKVGLRKPFTWPMHLMIFAGTLLAVCGQGWVRVLGICMSGFGNAGWAPALFTMPMEFGMDALETGVAFSFIFSLGQVAGFLSPLLGGWIGDVFSLKLALIVFAFAALLAAIATFLMQETGVLKV